VGAAAELAAKLETTLGRAASPAELGAAQDQWFEQEALYREALKLGLDKEDVVIREYLAGKLRRVVEARVVGNAPTEAELQSVYQANPARYAQALSYSLSHVFILNPSGQDVSERTKQLLAQLAAGADPEGLGDHFPRGAHFGGLSAAQLEAILDLRLEHILQSSELKKWHTLVGARGTHLVRLDAIAGPELAPADLHAALLADHMNQKKAESLRQFTSDLRKKYPGVVDVAAK
jgi:hypothetical protein